MDNKKRMNKNYLYIVIGVLAALVIVLLVVNYSKDDTEINSVLSGSTVREYQAPVNNTNIPAQPEEQQQNEIQTFPEDGIHNGFIKSIKKIGAKSYLEIDYVEIYGGDEGMRKAEEDGVCHDNDSCSVYVVRYTRNNNPKIRTFEIDSSVVFQFNNDEFYTLSQFYSDVSVRNKFGEGMLGNIEIKNNKLIKLLTSNAG